jgi:uncharacterized protein YqjF (DUF2071 family)
VACLISDILAQREHRPWAMPENPWMMTQTWEKLLFAHWPVDAAWLRSRIPPGLTLDCFDGQAWIGIVPFRMGFRLRYAPWELTFGELNVRTYVVADGKPGVFFFSLDASDWFTVHAARARFSLPYYHARVRLHEKEGNPPRGNGHHSGASYPFSTIHFHCQRFGKSSEKPAFTGQYQPVSPVFYSVPDSLDAWLTERYCLYAEHASGAIYRGNIHHLPWPLQQAEADVSHNTIAKACQIPLSGLPALLHYVDRIDVIVWPLERVAI